jgi:hypothetical protein
MRDFFDGGDAVVEEENLPAALDLGVDGLFDDSLVIRADLRHHGLLVRRRRLDGAHVTHAHEREVKRARNGRGAEREHIDEPEEVFELLFVLHAEALLLVDHREAEIFEAHVLRDHAMRADDDIDRAFADALHDLAFLVRRREAAEHFDGHGELAHALADVFVMLAGQNGRRHQNGDLSASHHRFERSANRHLGLPKADIGTKQAVHRLFGLHVAFDLLRAAELVGRFAIQKRLLELHLPLRVWLMRKGLQRLPFRRDAEHALREVLDALFGGGPRFFPARLGELAQRRRFATDADVATDHVDMRQRHEELRAVGVVQNEHFLLFAAVTHLHAHVATDAVLGMHDEIALAQLAEHIAGFAQRFGLIELRAAHAADVLMTAKNLRAGQNGQFGRWNGETAIQQPQLRLHRRRQLALQLVEALPLRLVVKEDDRAPARLVPFGDLAVKKLPPGLMQHEIRRIEDAERILMNGRREVFEPLASAAPLRMRA